MKSTEFLAELNMAPSSLAKILSSPIANEMTIGFEAEVTLPGDFSGGSHDDEESVPDYDTDEDIDDNTDIDSVRRFFGIGDRSVNRGIERLNSKFLDFRIEKESEFVAEHIDGEIEDIISVDDIDINSEDYDKDEVREQAEQNLQDCFIYPDFTEFCNSESMATMKDLSDEYGFDWPDWTTPGETETFNGAVADYVSSFPWKVEVFNEYHESLKDRNTWYFEPDTSISATAIIPSGEHRYVDYMGVEIVSPVLQLTDAMHTLDTLFEWLHENEATTNKSTGFHVNVGLGDTTQNVDATKLILFLGDSHILYEFSREANTYCSSVLARAKSKMSGLSSAEVDSFARSLKAGALQQLSIDLLIRTQLRNAGKYSSINLNGQYIEFRGLGGDYLHDLPLIKNTVLRIVNAYVVSCDPEAYKKEYMKKLYSLLMAGHKYDQDNLAAFVMFNTGAISKEDFVSSLVTRSKQRQANTAARPEVIPAPTPPTNQPNNGAIPTPTPTTV